MIWVLGNRGMLGRELVTMLTERGMEQINTGREVDITSLASLRSFAMRIGKQNRQIDWVVNCAGYTNVDMAEKEQDCCRLLNEEGPANVAEVAQSLGAKFIHISSDYVFDGLSQKPYREDDLTDPVGIYGKTKRAGEIRALNGCGKSWIVRTSWLYGRFGGNFVNTILDLMSTRAQLAVVNDQSGSPTYAKDLCRALYAIILGNSRIPAGVYHFANMGETTRYKFAGEIYRQGKALGLIKNECLLVPCTSDEYYVTNIRPLYTVLDKSKFQGVLDFPIPEWTESLSNYLKDNICVL